MTARILFSMSALAASLFAGAQAPASRPAHEAAPRLLRLVAPFVLSAAEHAPLEMPFTHAPAASITPVPSRGSLWMVASTVAIDSLERQHQREFLRC